MSPLVPPPIWLSHILWPIWWDMGHGVIVDTDWLDLLDFPAMLAWLYSSRGRELQPSPVDLTLEVWPLSLTQLGQLSLGIYVPSVWRISCWVEGYPQQPSSLHLVEDGDLWLEGEECLSSCIGSSNASGYVYDDSFVTSYPGVGKEGNLKSYSTVSFSNKFASVTLWIGPSTMPRRR